MDPAQPGLSAPPASPGPVDPTELVDAAAQQGQLAAPRPDTDTPEDVRASVDRWWSVTNNARSTKDAIAQYERDLETLLGDEKDNDDDTVVTVNHVYRNAIQTVAITVPEDHEFRWKPKRMAPSPDPLELEDDGGDPNVLRFAATLELLTRRYTEEIDFQDVLEEHVQDATHFRVAVLKITFQSDFASDPVQSDRLPDEQDNLASLRYLLERYARGEIDKTSPEWHDISLLMEGLGRSEVAVMQGLVVENVPVDQWGIDGSVRSPVNAANARFQWHDVAMTRKEVLSKWSDINPHDLGRATVYRIDEAGKRVVAKAAEGQADGDRSAGNVQYSRGGGTGNGRGDDDDILLVREIWDRTTSSVKVLVEGLEYYAAEWTPERQPAQWFPFFPIVLNRVPGRFHGLSDTELQAKIQRAINRSRTREEESKRAALPRFAYDSQTLSPEDAKRVSLAKPWEGIPLNLGGAKDIRQVIMPLVGNHEHNPVEHDTAPAQREMREMAALPEQALGVTGNANFSSEVTVAAQGASILTKYRQNKIVRHLRRIYEAIAQMLLQEVSQQMAVQLVGRYAVWPAPVADRQALYQGLNVEVDVGIDGRLDRAERVSNLAKILDAGAKLGIQAEPEPFLKIFGRLLGEGDSLKDLLRADPNALVARLMKAMQQRPQELTPQAAAALMQLAPLVQQVLAQAVAQQQAAAAAGGAPARGQPGPTPGAPAAAAPSGAPISAGPAPAAIAAAADGPAALPGRELPPNPAANPST